MTLMLRRQIFGIVITSSRSTLSDVVNVGYNPTHQRCNGPVAAVTWLPTITAARSVYCQFNLTEMLTVALLEHSGGHWTFFTEELQDVKHSQLQAVFYNHLGNCAPVPTPLKAAQRRSATPLGIPLAANFITLRIHQDRANVPSKAKTARSQLQSNQPGDRCCSNTTGKAAGWRDNEYTIVPKSFVHQGWNLHIGGI
ncbi:hypothetical protein C8F01DRAFT_1085119 [Mycena amicta]|nr:hypothetical protein C8F01DRAFT_1085119 [Mycena amicta]